jgi:hypothetical protein
LETPLLSLSLVHFTGAARSPSSKVGCAESRIRPRVGVVHPESGSIPLSSLSRAALSGRARALPCVPSCACPLSASVRCLVPTAKSCPRKCRWRRAKQRVRTKSAMPQFFSIRPRRTLKTNIHSRNFFGMIQRSPHKPTWRSICRKLECTHSVAVVTDDGSLRGSREP